MLFPDTHLLLMDKTPGSVFYDTLIIDLGDVLFNWCPSTTSAISPSSFRKVLELPAWAEFESGLITQAECYTIFGAELGVPVSDVELAFRAAVDSLQPDQQMISLLKTLRQMKPELKVYAMSNISLPDYELLRTKLDDWSMVDKVFISAVAHIRKPSFGFYQHVLEETKCDPSRTIFVDDKLDNVISARSFGMKGIVFDDASRVSRLLMNLIGDAVLRGQSFLTSNAGRHVSTTSNGLSIPENFAQLLLLDVSQNPQLAHVAKAHRLYNFFSGERILATDDFPCDLDTTSLALTTLDYQEEMPLVNSIMSEMLEYRNSDGIIQVYFDHDHLRPRTDAVVAINVLTLFYKYGRGHELPETLNWVYAALVNRAYIDGTRYYMAPECFLYFLNRLLSVPSFRDHIRPWHRLLSDRIRERIGLEGDALALAMRVIVCTNCGIRNHVDHDRLLERQAGDGSWTDGWIYRYPSKGVRLQNTGVTTALAIKAIDTFRKFDLPKQIKAPLERNSTISEKIPRRSEVKRMPIRRIHSYGGMALVAVSAFET